ncbi:MULTISPECIES: hypothetical protein [Streptomyces]|uniref:Uncharacterized protein n=1 Tax=Streptomyces nymphaeiformis TaxID=2663842 RepID=A0A7W7X980_9ACTN|nr:hypothetical protein [Streptomyces nymphaeiformis]MBB4979622.1 hypothetical protein [Streptomyces nymphaeiformis]
MTQDETLAAALHEAAAAVPVGTAPTAAVMLRGRTIRRRRRAMRSAVVAAAVLVPVAGAAFSATFDSPSTPPAPSAPAPAPAAVRVVDPGEKVPLGRGHTMRLTAQGLYLGVPKATEQLVKAAEVPGGKISATASGDGGGTVWAGIYRGPERPAGVTLSVGGRTVGARIVTLPGSPGWVAFHAYATRAGTDGSTITVLGADGTVLATLAKPGRG